jgi:GAF domain-containing protein
MGRRAKPAKAKVEAKPSVAPQSRKDDPRVRDLEKRLAEALKDKAEALEQQTATADILRVISASPKDLQPVLDAVAKSAARFCGADDGEILLLLGEGLKVAAHHGPIPSPTGRVIPVVRGSVAGRAVLERRPVQVADLQEETRDFALGSALARASGYRTTLVAPLLREGTVVGTIILRRVAKNPFTEKQIRLLQTFADQAVIAIENVRLFKELQASNRDLTTALDKQTATSDLLKVIGRSTFDLQPVFDTLAENAVRLCEGRHAMIFRFDGQALRVVASHNISPELKAFQQQNPIVPGRGSCAGRAALERRTVHIHDVRSDPEYTFGSREISPLRTMISVPMLRAGELLGAINIVRYEVLPFTDNQIALMETFADQAAIAIENVRLFTELQEKNRALTEAHAQVIESLEQQTATAEILRVISSSPTDVQPVFDAIAEQAMRLCEAIVSNVCRFDGELVHLAATTNVDPDGVTAIRGAFPMRLGPQSAATRTVLKRTLVHIPDILDDPEYGITQQSLASGFRSVLAVPMLRDGSPLGSIIVGRPRPGPFSARQIALLETFADQAVIAIENVRLFKELQASNRDLTTALDKQTATSDILRVISRSQTDVQPVFDTIVHSAVSLLRGYSGTLTRVVGGQIELAAFTSTGADADAALKASYPRSLESEGTLVMAIRERIPLNVATAQTDPRLPQVQRTFARVRGFQSLAAVPLLRHDEAVGAIMVTRREPGGFTDEEIALLKTFADQAVIAIENVRLFTELEEKNRALTTAHAQVSEALDQQTATSEILRVISQWQTDAQPVFDAIADNVMRLFRSWGTGLYRFDGEFVHIVAVRGGSPGSEQYLREQGPYPVSRDTPIRQCFLDRSIVHIPDIDTVADMSSENREMARVRGWRALLAVPMLREGRPIGVIAVTRAEAVAFSPAEIDLLQTFADQAVIAIENVRLFKELEARTHDLTRSVDELTALGEVGRALSSTLNLEDVLQTIAKRATQLTETAGCVIWEYDKPREEFRLRVSHYTDDSDAAILPARGGVTTISKGQGLTTQVMEERQPVQILDIAVEGAYESPVRKPLIDAGHRALLGVPLLSEDEVVGVLAVTRKTPGEFDPEVIRLLSTFANQSALAIQNARLFQDIEEKSRQLEAASQHKSEFLANMSHELRTPLNAIIGFSEVLTERMFGDLNEKQEEYLKDISSSGTHLLSLINDILDLSKIEAGRMELELTDFDLPTALENALTLVRERAGRRNIILQMSVDKRLGEVRADERKIRQVVLNLLSNSIKFTPEGGRIEVAAVPKDGLVEVSVSDTGVGIVPEEQEAVFEEFRQVGTAEKKAEGTGLGLTLCRKFIELHGGRIWVKSQVGEGSTFTFTIPVRLSE